MSRHAFWTIIVGGSPTAFRAPLREDLQPTLVQLLRKQPDAAIRWFEKGQLWETPGHAQDAAKARQEAERPRRGASWRPGGDHKDPREKYKLPRDVKRKRWASQAAEGRGPWSKGKAAGPGGPRTGEPSTGGPRTGGPEERRTGGQGRPRTGGQARPRSGGAEERRTGGSRPAAASSDRRNTGPKSGAPPRSRPPGAKTGTTPDRRPAGAAGRRPRQDKPPIPGRTPNTRGAERPDAPPRPPKARTPNVFKAGQKPSAPRKKRDDE